MDASHKRVEKRNRPPVSCENCRTRKLKCNRELPCDSCIKRNKASSCQYAANANRNKPAPSKTRDLSDRLDSLAHAVTFVLDGKGNTAAQPLKQQAIFDIAAEKPALAPEMPHVQETESGQVNYIDRSHWLSVLNDIKEVREQLEVASPGSQEAKCADSCTSNMTDDDSYLFNPVVHATLEDIFRRVPPRSKCDILISWYFNSRYMVLGVVHPDKFGTEYEAFWESPSTTSRLWLGLLFALLAIASILRSISRSSEPPDPDLNPAELQMYAVQCLVSGKFANANAHALEAFVLHLQSQIFVGGNCSYADPWFEMGVIIRLAFRMGYHRDPSRLPGVSVFDGEMRRRVWVNIVQIESLMSFQLGFPSMIPMDFCDTADPLNLQYTDLQVGMTALPPARPLTEHTPMSYAIAKMGVMRVFKKIVGHTQSLHTPTYVTTMTLDAEMRQAYSQMPEPFKPRNVNRSFMDTSDIIFQRATIEVLYLKGLIILHRRYITHEPQSTAFEMSRRACVEAACVILARQADLHQACSPGGRLQDDQSMFVALPMHDFLLAVMIIGLDLSTRLRLGLLSQNDILDQQTPTGKEFEALQKAGRIWSVKDTTRSDARLAALAIDIMIKKLTVGMPPTTPSKPVCMAPSDMQANGLDSYECTVMQLFDGEDLVDWGAMDQFFQTATVQGN